MEILEAASAGGLLNGLKVDLRRAVDGKNDVLLPLCLLGSNGTGKSQFLQIIAELFQSAWHTHRKDQERAEANPSLNFRLIYEITPSDGTSSTRVRISRLAKGTVTMEVHNGEEYQKIEPYDKRYGNHLPPAIVAYTSGDNETLSLPFFVSRSEYAENVRTAALDVDLRRTEIPDNRMLLVDYGTHLEVLISNLMLGSEALRGAIIAHAKVSRLASWRCIIQLNHPAAPKTKSPITGKRGVQLTEELEKYISNLKKCATCWHYNEKTDSYVLDFLVDEATRVAFRNYWESASHLYRSLHKLAMLNDLIIPKSARNRVKKEIDKRRFASRLPEPQDETKVFRFEEVRFFKGEESSYDKSVDYVSLSDGEHQQAEIFGIFGMLNQPNVLFLLDEPESHFNPRWRVKFIRRLMELPVQSMSSQEVVLTSHAPFVASDISRDQVRIFTKNQDDTLEISKPEIETYGATYDRILSHCFGVEPPISEIAQAEIKEVSQNGSPEEIKELMDRLGSSVERALLADRLIEISRK
ncbi:restriction system-associated AAA family ATPase [Agrobacterium rhizogenes]|nr:MULTISPECIES: restriction system-associated AAA family ATPase [Rhizobium/Agrobacterium group]MCZ7445392.1 restriction system-associated AAA family ATPase [Rhizobium rhizogenes]